jgi:hypothetical protein
MVAVVKCLFIAATPMSGLQVDVDCQGGYLSPIRKEIVSSIEEEHEERKKERSPPDQATSLFVLGPAAGRHRRSRTIDLSDIKKLINWSRQR